MLRLPYWQYAPDNSITRILSAQIPHMLHIHKISIEIVSTRATTSRLHGVNAVCLGGQKLSPGGTAVCAVNAGALEDRPPGACRNRVGPARRIRRGGVSNPRRSSRRPAAGPTGAAGVGCGGRRFGDLGAGLHECGCATSALYLGLVRGLQTACVTNAERSLVGRVS